MKKNILKGTSLVLLASMALVACKKESNFSVVNSTAWVGEPVVIKDGQEKIKNATYFYDFGDGSSVSGISADVKATGNVNPSHIYYKAGVYTITQQISKANKKGGKTVVGSQTVTVQMVTPTMELSVAAPNTDQLVMIKNTTDESANKGSDVSYAVVIEGPNGTTRLPDNWNSYSDTRSFDWTPATSGAYKITLYAMQGASQSMVSSDVTVTGNNASSIANMLNGKWNVATTASLTGSSYGAGCTAQNLVSRYSSISINDDNYIYAAVEANQGGANSTATAGNILGGQGSINVIDANHVTVNPNFFVNSSTTGFNQASSSTGVYVIKSSSATSITLERVEKGNDFCAAAADSYTDTYTITLTR